MNDEQLKRSLQSVGQTCFVGYYDLFSNFTIDNVDIIEMIKTENNYTEASCASRTSQARRIIRANRGPDALRIVVNSNSPIVTRPTRLAAQAFLEGQPNLNARIVPPPTRARPRSQSNSAPTGHYGSLFSMPNPVKITGRSSSITNSFINSIIPVIQPTAEQVQGALKILGMDQDSYACAYCGSNATEWDHLRPLVKDKKPTGYISEIHNLVPACGKCNQSKGNKDWAGWMLSDAKLSPKTRGISDLDTRMARLEAYEQSEEPTLLDFKGIVGEEKWKQHWANWQHVQDTMRHAQELAEEIRQTVANYHHEPRST